MLHRRGPPRKLTRTQIRQVLAWHTRWQQFRAVHGTAVTLAARLHVNVHVIHYCITHYRRRGVTPASPVDRSVVLRGRPSVLSVAKARRVIAWYRDQQRFLAVHGSAQSLARTLGVSLTTVYACIRRAGRYHPGSRAEMTGRTSVDRRLTRARTSRGTHTESDAAQCSRLLKNWRRPRSMR